MTNNRKSFKNSVLLLGPSLSAVSGVSTHLLQITKSSLMKNFKLYHYQIGSEGREESTVRRVARYISSPVQLFIFIAKKKPVIVHINSSMAILSFWRDTVYMLVSKVWKCKIVFQIHGGIFPDNLKHSWPLLNRVVIKILRIADAVVVLSDEAICQYSRYLSKNKLYKIPNAIDLREYSKLEAKGIKDQEIRLVYIGRLSKNKGIYEGLSAISMLKKEVFYNDIKFHIAGSGPEGNNLKMFIHKIGINNKVVWHGPIFGKGKVDFWEKASIFIFPTYHKEGLPYTVIEALASGTPIITTKVAGIRDAITNGKQGYFVEPKNVKQLSNKIKEILNNRNNLKEISSACIETAKTKYDSERLSKQFKSLYDKLSENDI